MDRGASLLRRPALLLSALGLLTLLGPGARAGPAPADLAEMALRGKLIVIGRLARIEREPVSVGGRKRRKYTGFIRVEKVLLMPAGFDVPSTLRVEWGDHLPGEPVVQVRRSAFVRGVWVFERLPERGPNRLTGPQDGFFVAEEMLLPFLDVTAKTRRLTAEIEVGPEWTVLKLRHLNFGNWPRQARQWAMQDGVLLAPAPYSLVARASPDAGPSESPVYLRTGRLRTRWSRAATVPPHSFLLQEISLGDWPLRHGRVEAFLQRTDRSDWAVPIRRRSRGDRFDTNEARAVWWFPSSARLRWLAGVGCPLLMLGAAALWRSGRRRPAFLCTGASLGLLWSWLLARHGLDTCLAALVLAEDLAEPRIRTAVVLAGIFGATLLAGGATAALWRERRQTVAVTVGLLWAVLVATRVESVVAAAKSFVEQWPIRRLWPTVWPGGFALLLPLAAGAAALRFRRHMPGPGAWLTWIPWILLPAATVLVGLLALGAWRVGLVPLLS